MGRDNRVRILRRQQATKAVHQRSQQRRMQVDLRFVDQGDAVPLEGRGHIGQQVQNDAMTAGEIAEGLG